MFLQSLLEEPSKFGSSTAKKSSLQGSLLHNRNSLSEHNRELMFLGQPGDDLLTFHYRKGIVYAMVNRDLRLKNDSSTHFIRFKIQSSNPTRYKVHPSSAEIAPNKTIEVVIQITGLDEIAEIGPNFFSKVENDKFRISWFAYRDSERHYAMNKTLKFESRRVFRVHVAIEEQVEKEESGPKPMELGEKVGETLEMHRREKVRLDRMIEERELMKESGSCLSFSSVMVLGILAFVVGVFLPV